MPANCTRDLPSADFHVVALPAPARAGLAPGDRAEIVIRFSAPAQPDLFGNDTYQALLQVTLTDPNAAPGAETITVPPVADNAPNLQAQVGASSASVLPAEVDFGTELVGCCSAARAVTLHNLAPAPFTVAEVVLEGCSAEVTLSHVPPLPAEVTAGSAFEVRLVYCPQQEGAMTCQLKFTTDVGGGEVVVVPIRGNGSTAAQQVDVFQLSSENRVDLLFVIDDSGSMCEEQDRLRANLTDFVAAAQTWETDFHIGVVNTCVQEENICPGAGQLQSVHPGERWVTSDNWEHLLENVDLGCGNGSDSQEAGLEAARLALSPPQNALTDQDCATAGDCDLPYECLADLGRCGGSNGGFRRADAALEIVFLSDEEDQSPGTVEFYVEFLRGLVGAHNPQMLHAHAIVGDAVTGCTGAAGVTEADPGERYIEVAERTGGVFASICDDSFAAALTDIGSLAFGLSTQFFLSRPPAAGTIEVSVDGDPCAVGWSYDAASNSVVFDPEGTCAPGPGQDIEIRYDVVCPS